ncbi:SusC/RagA family TonB-linked outer membrane protein, partial [Parabacteroides sp. AF17-28]
MNLFNTLELDFSPTLKKILSVMRLTMLCLLVFSLNISASVYSQNTKLSLNVENQSIKDILYLIENQSDFRFIYESGEVDLSKKVTVNVKEQTVEAVLKQLFENVGINYEITENNLILINPSTLSISVSSEIAQKKKIIKGVVKDINGEPIIGANVVEKGTTNGIITDIDGKFSLEVATGAILQISFVGYSTQEVEIRNQSTVSIKLKEDSE